MVTSRQKRREAVFRAIADPTRRDILELLRGSPRTVGEIAGNFRMSRPAISKHVGVLRSAGLVMTRKDRSMRLCELNAKPLQVVDDWLREYAAFWATSLRDLKNYVEEKQ
jgi:DNA-binding transcriptional ArsR family regulator